MEAPAKRTTTTKEEDACATALLDRFEVETTFGGGANLVVHEKKTGPAVKFVLKVKSYDIWSKTECLVALGLNNVRTHTFAFAWLYGTFVCSVIPKPWTQYVPSALKGPFVFLLEESPYCSWDVVARREVNDLISYLFVLIHGLAHARKMYPNFNLRNIARNNIMFRRRGQADMVLPYRCVMPGDIGNTKKYYAIRDLEYVPMFVDFHEATLNAEATPDFYDDDDKREFSGKMPTNDLFRLLYWVPRMYPGADKINLERDVPDFQTHLTYWKSTIKKIVQKKDEYYKPGPEVLENFITAGTFRRGSNITLVDPDNTVIDLTLEEEEEEPEPEPVLPEEQEESVPLFDDDEDLWGNMELEPAFNFEFNFENVNCQICMSRPAKFKYGHTKDPYYAFCSRRCEARLRPIKDILP